MRFFDHVPHYGATVLQVGPHFVSIAHKDTHARMRCNTVIQSCNHFHVTLANVAMAMRNTLFKEKNKTNKKQNSSANIYGEGNLRIHGFCRKTVNENEIDKKNSTILK